MKNKASLVCVVASGIFLLSSFYLLSPKVAININRICEMLYTGSSKGIVMYYYDLGVWSYAASIGIAILQTLLPPLSKGTLIMANHAFFGSVAGFVLSLFSITIGSICAYITGRSLGTIFRIKQSGIPIEKYRVYFVFTCQAIPWWPLAFINYLSGFTAVNFSKFLYATLAGKIIAILTNNLFTF